MNSVATKINPTMVVNEIVRLYPATIPILNEFGIDSCCGGGVTLAVAAERDGADLNALLDRLTAAAAGS